MDHVALNTTDECPHAVHDQRLWRQNSERERFLPQLGEIHSRVCACIGWAIDGVVVGF